MSLAFILESLEALVKGVPLTLALASSAIVFGGILAAILTMMRLSENRLLAWPANAYVFAFRGSPLLVQIFLVYYGLGQFRPTLQAIGLWEFFREPYWCATAALSLNTAAYVSEIFRGGLAAVPAQQVEAARSTGMSGLLLFRRIVFPIALRQALPAYGNEMILMVKATSLASVITMMEVTGIAAKLISESYRAIEVFIAAGAVYLAINFVLTRLISALEWRLTPYQRMPRSAPKDAVKA